MEALEVRLQVFLAMIQLLVEEFLKSKKILKGINSISSFYLPVAVDVIGFGDVDFDVVELAHIEQLISNVCLSCDDVVSLFNADG